MKSSITKHTFKAIYRLLNRVNPVDYDCGALCHAACCNCISSGTSDDEDDSLGIYLLPGEEKIFTRKESWLGWNYIMAEDYEFPESWHGKVFFLQCKARGNCPREQRPIQCRTFPLTPHLDKNGVLLLIYQKGQLPYSCPLISEKKVLNDDFIKGTYTVWKHLIREPLIFDLVEADSQYRINECTEIDIVYPYIPLP